MPKERYITGALLRASGGSEPCAPSSCIALRTWAMGIAARRGKQVAVVALARRLTGRLYALLRDGTVFEPQRSASSASSRCRPRGHVVNASTPP